MHKASDNGPYMPTPTLEPPIAKAKCDMNWNDEGEWLEGNADRVGEDVD